MKRRLLAGALAATMALSMTACGSGGGSSDTQGSGSSDGSPTTLNLILRAGAYADVIKECLPKFEEEHNVKCEVQELSESDLYSGIALDAINQKGSYDLCMVDGSWMAEFTENGVLANLSDLGYELDDDIIPATTSICYVGDDVYLAPYYGNVTVLMLNKENVKAAGYTADTIESLDDVLAVCEKAKADGKKGFIASVDTGAATMGIGWPGWYAPTADSTADYIALSGAVSKGGETHNANVYGIWTIGIPANSQNQELAAELLTYLMDKDVQKSTVDKGGVPCRYSSLQDPEILKTYPQYEVVCKALEGGVYRPVIAEWTQFYTILGTEMDNIINGVKTVDQGLADAQSQLETLMAG